MSSDLVRAPGPGEIDRPGHAEWWNAWLGNYSSERTKAEYRRDVGQWASWCYLAGVDLRHPAPGHVSAWVESMRTAGAREATLARKVAALASFYKWARHEGLTSADPMPFRRPTAVSDDADKLGLDVHTARAVLNAAPNLRAAALLRILLFCALRVSEALAIDVEDMKEKRGHRVVSVVGKGGRPRTVPIPPQAWSAVCDYLEGRTAGPLFISRRGRRMDRRTAWRIVERAGRDAGVAGFHPHLLRHTAITLALDAGAPLDRVQAVAGHADPRTTMIYAKARERLDTSAVYDLARLLSGA